MLNTPPSEAFNETARAAAAQVAVGARDMTKADLDNYSADGLDPLSYVELVGIVARTTAIDTATIGLGAELQPFPTPTTGDPRRPAAAAAKQRSAWVPTVGAAGAGCAARAALVIANFEMMNRILDATGVPVPTRMGEITSELGLPAYTQRH